VPRQTFILTVGKARFRGASLSTELTPFWKPEWEGHVTLEFFQHHAAACQDSNANEGVAQMLFFESDEACSTS